MRRFGPQSVFPDVLIAERSATIDHGRAAFRKGFGTNYGSVLSAVFRRRAVVALGVWGILILKRLPERETVAS